MCSMKEKKKQERSAVTLPQKQRMSSLSLKAGFCSPEVSVKTPQDVVPRGKQDMLLLDPEAGFCSPGASARTAQDVGPRGKQDVVRERMEQAYVVPTDLSSVRTLYSDSKAVSKDLNVVDKHSMMRGRLSILRRKKRLNTSLDRIERLTSVG